MRTQACEVLEGCDARRLPNGRVKTAMADIPASGILLGTTVHRLNQRGLALLARAARASDCAELQSPLMEILSLWARASESTLARAARCPMVLLDFNFQHVAWWSRAIDAQPTHDRQPSASAFYTDDAIPLARDLLLEAWSAARSMSSVSSLVFGMAPEVTKLIARLSPRELDRVVMREIQEMRPRWANRPMFWRELFHAATEMDDQILANVYLHCLQLLGGELVSTLVKTPPASTGAKGPVTAASVHVS